MPARNPAAIQFARQLRKNSTDAERRLWYQVRDRRLEGWKFRRQVPIGPFVADFVCADARLVVEIDGGQHGEREERDMARTAYLESCGYRVVRFWNNEVMADIEGVLTALTLALSPQAGKGKKNPSP